MGELLDQIDGPADVKALGPEQLPQLAEELRERIVQHVRLHGGHLGAGLGLVELTIALHRVFDLDEDRLCWDVGHGCYPHKLLTGRADRFHTLRQLGGLSGFPNRFESGFDPFTTGHAGTAISSALGLVCGDQIAGRKRRVIALVGDGGLTCGMAFEGLNHAGALDWPLLVILNDNQLSIAETQGALVRYLNRIRLRPGYSRVKDEVETILASIPVIGEEMVEAVHQVKRGIRAAVVPGQLFKELGFRYFGPFDGHDVHLLEKVLENLREAEGPVLLHVITEKGRGWPGEDRSPDAIHARSAPGPDKVADEADREKRRPSWTSVFADALVQCGEEDPRVVAVTAAMPAGTGVDRFAARFPERAWDTGISEQHAVTFAGGLALAGLRPVCAIYSTFLQRAFDSVVHDVALQQAPVVLAVDRGGIAGNDGATHNGFLDIAYLRPIPGLVHMAPADEEEMHLMLRFALEQEGPAALRYARAPVPAPLPYPGGRCPPVELGRGCLVVDGDDLVLIGYGDMVATCLEARELLARHGLGAAVVNARFAQPLDEALLLELARREVPIMTVEDHLEQGGFGAAVLECFAARLPRMPRITVAGLPREFIEHGDRETILDLVGLSARRLTERAIRLVQSPLRPSSQVR